MLKSERFYLPKDFSTQVQSLRQSIYEALGWYCRVLKCLYGVTDKLNRFEAGSMLQPLTSPDRTQKILDEVGAVYDVVDGMMQPQGRGNSA